MVSGVAGITLTLNHDPSTGTPASASTDENGHYVFSKLEPGKYILSISAPGFKPVSKSLVL